MAKTITIESKLTNKQQNKDKKLIKKIDKLTARLEKNITQMMEITKRLQMFRVARADNKAA